MSLHHTAYIMVCDGCGKAIETPEGSPKTFSTNVSAIIAARQEGWLVNQKGLKDYCPACRSKIENQ